MGAKSTETSSRHTRRTFGVPWSGRHDLGHPVVKASHDDRTFGERVADSVAKFGGSWPFIFTFLSFIVCWMLVNTLVLGRLGSQQEFDPYPYIALNLALSAMAGLQAPIIMMSQNRAASRDEALAADHYSAGQRAENLIETTQRLVEQNTEMTQKIHDLSVQIRELVAARA